MNKCPYCNSSGFPPSKMKDRCTFCDGTEGGHPPTEEEVEEHNRCHAAPLKTA